jgi:3-deoxy-manno-octulosonate cytidylyltransferase (CMP-KDO synthetase)
MLWHVYQGVSKAKRIDGIYVLTDSQEILEAATSWGATALMTSEECPSGTARIAEVIDQLDGDIVVNVQADEPLITGAVVDAVVGALENGNADVATPVYRLTKMEEVADPNLVKVVRSADGLALYFSRSPIPYVRDQEPNGGLLSSTFWGHAGIYAYRRNALREYMQLPESQLEQAEKLEQLRLLEAGKKILTVEIEYRPHGVDVPADLEAVKEILDAQFRRE